MVSYWAERALLGDHVVRSVRITVDHDLITDVAGGQAIHPEDSQLGASSFLA